MKFCISNANDNVLLGIDTRHFFFIFFLFFFYFFFFFLQMKLFSLVYSTYSICVLNINVLLYYPIKHTHVYSMFCYCTVVGHYAVSALLLLMCNTAPTMGILPL